MYQFVVFPYMHKYVNDIELHQHDVSHNIHWGSYNALQLVGEIVFTAHFTCSGKGNTKRVKVRTKQIVVGAQCIFLK